MANELFNRMNFAKVVEVGDKFETRVLFMYVYDPSIDRHYIISITHKCNLVKAEYMAFDTEKRAFSFAQSLGKQNYRLSKATLSWQYSSQTLYGQKLFSVQRTQGTLLVNYLWMDDQNRLYVNNRCFIAGSYIEFRIDEEEDRKLLRYLEDTNDPGRAQEIVDAIEIQVNDALIQRDKGIL